MEVLIGAGSDVRAQNNDGQSAAERAANRHINPKRTDTVAYLKHVVRTLTYRGASPRVALLFYDSLRILSDNATRGHPPLP